MDYQILVISEMHYDGRGNAVKGSSPLHIDSPSRLPADSVRSVYSS